MIRALKELLFGSGKSGTRPGVTTISPEAQEMLKTDELIWQTATDPNIPAQERADIISELMKEK